MTDELQEQITRKLYERFMERQSGRPFGDPDWMNLKYEVKCRKVADELIALVRSAGRSDGITVPRELAERFLGWSPTKQQDRDQLRALLARWDEKENEG